MDQFYFEAAPGSLVSSSVADPSRVLHLSAFQIASNISSPPASVALLCHNKLGWGPFDSTFSLTPCFIEGVVLNLPNLFLWVFGSVQIYLLSKRSLASPPLNWHISSKIALVSLQIAFFLSLAFVKSRTLENPTIDIAFWSPLLSAATLLVAWTLHWVERSLFVPSGALLFYWLFEIAVTSIKTYHLLLSSKSHHSSLFVLNIFIWVNSIFIFFLEWLVPKIWASDPAFQSVFNKSPLDSADIFSRITFSWMTPLMKRGYDVFLTADDLPELPTESSTAYTSTVFAKNWQQQLSANRHPSLVIALVKSFGSEYFIGGCFKFLQDVLAFTQPQLLRLLIRFVNDYSKGKPDATVTKGLSISLAMFLLSILQTAALQAYFQRSFNFGLQIRTSLTSTVFSKTLVLSTEDRAKKSTGEIVNLMAIDTQRLQDVTTYLQSLWSAPFQIVLCLVSLHRLVGNAMWAGVLIMVVNFIIQTPVAKHARSLQQTQMKIKDKRVRVTQELLNNIKSLKLYSWEIPFTNRLNFIREQQELKNLKAIGIFMSVVNFLWTSTPFMVSCSTFAVYALSNNIPLTTDVVFPCLNLFNLLTFPLAIIPMVISALIEANVSAKRIVEYVTMDEIQPDGTIRLDRASANDEEAVIIDRGTFLWQRHPSVKIALSDINFKGYKGQLNCIVGKVGSGKSALLQAILGDLHKSEGLVTVKGHIAYVAQGPWIMNATVKENILFGSKYDPSFYQRTIEACALADDFTILPDGDNTFVGEKGISLSGGQKARLSLARAVYARADIYLLDDVLSAVDEHVGAHIIDQVLGETGLLSTKCKILCTNSIPVLSHADSITMVSNGRIIESGDYTKVMESKGEIFNLLKEFGKRKAPSTPAIGNSRSPSGTTTPVTIEDFEAEQPVPLVKRRVSTSTLRRASVASFKRMHVDDEEHNRRTKMTKEHIEQGKVKWDVYKEYARACNPVSVFFVFFFMVLASICSVSSGFWLKHWSEENTRTGSNAHLGRYLGVYFAICISASLSSVAYTLVLMIGCSIQAATTLHRRMLDSVVRAPMQWHWSSPIGRTLNRFNNDMNRIDTMMARVFAQFFSNSLSVTMTLIIIIYNTPPFALLIAPLGFMYIYYQRYYLRTSRELKRLESVSKSPIYTHFQETLAGLSTIRAYGQQDRFSYINESSLDTNIRAYFPSISANRWLAVRLEFLGSIIILCASGLSILMISTGHVTAGSIGLAMSYALQITQSLNWIVRMNVEVETNIVSVERVLEYSNITPEAPAIIENHRPAITWPEEGAVEFNHYSAKYRPELELILKDINLKIKPHEKIGIVGRTGAGKSSITLALFRIIEPAEGEIIIDDIDASTIGLADLRHGLSIIPQEAQTFEGSFRDNLDPNHEHDDAELWRVLEIAHLKPHIVDNMDGGLDAIITEDGSNLSFGQRQLLAIARAALTRSKVLVLDEATAAVDVETDMLIQKTIREEFKDRTILTIAHRLNTIIDSDRIVVLSEGQVVEFASPQELLKDKDSLFYSLARQGGLVHDDEETIFS